MEKRDSIDCERSTAEGIHERRKVRSNERGFRTREPRRQGDVEAELVEDIGIAPAPQERLLAPGEPGASPPFQLFLRRRRPESIEARDTIGGKAIGSRRRLGECQRPEAVKPREAQCRSQEASARGGEGCERPVKGHSALPIGESKGWFQRRMEAIQARLSGDLGQFPARNARHFHVRARNSVAQPHMPEAAERGATRGRKIDRIPATRARQGAHPGARRLATM